MIHIYVVLYYKMHKLICQYNIIMLNNLDKKEQLTNRMNIC
ncbi:hypothetical protein CLOHYLEM_07704 [[Clostridium] hylemonae DSM 15053]|uniref:Uncharacterized protein n=1 Tax=[Clostridium] hylemonae DSM 15053 TaxID=553973 RepID=C0C6G7_9FIRM|nr:hypothetical protein CLOHYLEM_07704 [[Clostridium] hylemonae DSM 15053]